jgi:hypothetical protein
VDKAKSKTRVLLVLLIVLLALNGIVSWYMYYVELNRSNQTIVQNIQIQDEKESLQSELEELSREYEALIAENKGLEEKLSAEQLRIEELMEELKNTSSSDRARISQLKKEMNALKEIMKGFVRQIDSLNRLNQTITAENVRVMSENQEYKQKTQTLISEKEELTEQIEIASIVKARNLTATPVNHKGKSRDKAAKVDRVDVCLTLSENDIVDKGSRFVFIRISRPDNLVLARSEEDMFSFGGSKIIFSAKRMVDYQGKDTDFCVFWKKEQELIPGTYHVDVFMDSQQIGSTSFSLK